MCPMPISVNEERMMFVQWPGLFIHAATTASGDGPMVDIGAFERRVAGPGGHELRVVRAIGEHRAVAVEVPWPVAPDTHLAVSVVVVEPLTAGRTTPACYSTCADASAEQVWIGYTRRWSIEETCQNTKTPLGFEEPQGWIKRAVERTAPTAILLDSLVLWWFAAHGHRCYRPWVRPWYRGKSRPAYPDRLATPRQEGVRDEVSVMRPQGRGSRNLVKTLLCAVRQAA